MQGGSLSQGQDLDTLLFDVGEPVETCANALARTFSALEALSSPAPLAYIQYSELF
jgi:hypothetical protein